MKSACVIPFDAATTKFLRTKLHIGFLSVASGVVEDARVLASRAGALRWVRFVVSKAMDKARWQVRD